MTVNQKNVLEALLNAHTRNGAWLPLSTLESFDGRTVGALQRKGYIDVDLEYGVRVSSTARRIVHKV